ncbi:NADP-dependent oxidoreductase [Adhaeribacter aquaticus]|uniref:NADP-dependent oxidoreductase n=1 Tax=Adhaeribacter aquaticus TaxID=299567 RepID=UPI0003F78BF0|nr:NADP-dependent oxidoreductase [Adhaeribacter aquaticus]
MKAIVLTEPGGIENLTITEIERPAIQKDEVLVKVKAISLNPVDVKSRSGKGVYGRIKEGKPLILGWDISGEVTQVGEDVTSFKPGDEVFGMVNFPGHGKAYAEYVAAPANHLAIKPTKISHAEAAAATLANLTAWQVLVQQAHLKTGQRVLIHAAAGGVGHFAVQIAKHYGATVIGTASAANADFLKNIGVDEHLDYTQTNFETAAHNIDIVLDPLGGDNTRKSLEVLKAGGYLISIVGGVTEEIKNLAEQKGISAANYLVQSSGSDMEQLAQLLQSGEIKAHVYQEYPFENIGEAHQQVETAKTRGKVVVLVD